MIRKIMIIFISLFSLETYAKIKCEHKAPQMLIDPIKNLCEIKVNMPACKELEKDELINCSSPYEKSKLKGADFIFKCAEGFGDNLVKMKDFVADFISDYWKKLFSISSFKGIFQAKKKVDRYVDSVKLYLTTEYERLRKIYGRFGALRHMGSSVWNLIINTVSNILTETSQQYSCMNQDAKNLWLCETVATAFVPPAAVLGLLKYGVPAISKFSNLKKSFSKIKRKKKKSEKTLGELLEEEKKNRKDDDPKKDTKKMKKKKKVSLNQIVLIPLGGAARYAYGKVTSVGRDNVVVTYIGSDNNPHIKVLPKDKVQKVSGLSKEAQKLNAFEVDATSHSSLGVKRKVKRLKPKKESKNEEPIKASDIWKPVQKDYPKIGSKIKFKAKNGKVYNAEVSAHGRSGYSGYYVNEKGEAKIIYLSDKDHNALKKKGGAKKRPAPSGKSK